MISKQDLERLIERQDGDRPVLSLFLDMSVNSDNKRTHEVFLGQKRAQLMELDGELVGNGGDLVAPVLDRVEEWLDTEYDEANRGVVVYAEIGGDWFEPLQFPVPVQNRLVMARRPAVGPLAQVLESYDHYGVILVDREHVRILSVYLGTLLDELEHHGDPFPAPHDVHAGGYAAARYQRHKLEEAKHFFKDFADEVVKFVKRHHPDHLVLLGTDENVAKFREYLPDSVLQQVVYTGPARVDRPASEILLKLEPHLRAEQQRENQEIIEQVRDRVVHDYLATAGLNGTLTALQEGKVDTLVLARDGEHPGVRCGRCGFVFAREVEKCPYDGSRELAGVDVMEEMVRMAAAQEAEIAFADASSVEEFRGAAALLRF